MGLLISTRTMIFRQILKKTARMSPRGSVTNTCTYTLSGRTDWEFLTFICNFISTARSPTCLCHHFTTTISRSPRHHLSSTPSLSPSNPNSSGKPSIPSHCLPRHHPQHKSQSPHIFNSYIYPPTFIDKVNFGSSTYHYFNMNRNLNLPNINNAILTTSIQHIQTAVHLMDCPNEVLLWLATISAPKTSLPSWNQVVIWEPTGIDPDPQDPGGKTRDTCVVSMPQSTNYGRVFVEEPTSWRHPTGNHHSALEYAAMGGHESVVKLLR